MKLKIKLLCILQLIGVSAFTQGIQKELDNYFLALNQNQEFNGSVLFAEKGQIIYQKSFGYSDFKKEIINTDSTLINIASISKTFTAIAILQLKERGNLSLDDAYIKYFPEFPYPEITIKQLLSHTSGLPDNEALLDSIITKNPGKIFTNNDIIPALILYKKTKELRFKPGEKWGYSNIGYSLLALLVEKVSNQPFDVYMKSEIFIPAGMSHSYIQTSLSQKADKNRCNNYMYNNHYEMKLLQMDSLPDWKEFTYNLTGLTGSTNVISSINDLWAYDNALYAGKLLKPIDWQEAFTPVKLNNGEVNKAINGSYGLGWFIETDFTGGKTVSHSGAAPGVTTFFIRNLINKRTLIILQNIQNPSFDISSILAIQKGKSVAYKKSIAFAYANDLYEKGPEYALGRLHERQSDTIHYALTEKEMARVGLEFSRSKNYQQYCLEAYKLNIEFFSNSWKAYDDYANALLKNNQKENAIKMYKKSIEINPNNQNSKKVLEQISK
jgi:CubicO group peptidase (beta-lactamase class C family)